MNDSMQLETTTHRSKFRRMARHQQCSRSPGKHLKVNPQTHPSRQAWMDGSASSSTQSSTQSNQEHRAALNGSRAGLSDVAVTA